MRFKKPETRSQQVLCGIVVCVSILTAWLIWNQPWLSEEDKLWNQIAKKGGADVYVMRDVLRAGDPQRTKTTSRSQFEAVLEGTNHPNWQVRESAYSALGFLAREDRFRAEAISRLSAAHSDTAPQIQNNASHYEMLGNAPGWRENLIADIKVPERAMRAQRDLEIGEKWWGKNAN